MVGLLLSLFEIICSVCMDLQIYFCFLDPVYYIAHNSVQVAKNPPVSNRTMSTKVIKDLTAGTAGGVAQVWIVSCAHCVSLVSFEINLFTWVSTGARGTTV